MQAVQFTKRNLDFRDRFGLNPIYFSGLWVRPFNSLFLGFLICKLWQKKTSLLGVVVRIK